MHPPPAFPTFPSRPPRPALRPAPPAASDDGDADADQPWFAPTAFLPADEPVAFEADPRRPRRYIPPAAQPPSQTPPAPRAASPRFPTRHPPSPHPPPANPAATPARIPPYAPTRPAYPAQQQRLHLNAGVAAEPLAQDHAPSPPAASDSSRLEHSGKPRPLSNAEAPWEPLAPSSTFIAPLPLPNPVSEDLSLPTYSPLPERSHVPHSPPPSTTAPYTFPRFPARALKAPPKTSPYAQSTASQVRPVEPPKVPPRVAPIPTTPHADVKQQEADAEPAVRIDARAVEIEPLKALDAEKFPEMHAEPIHRVPSRVESARKAELLGSSKNSSMTSSKSYPVLIVETPTSSARTSREGVSAKQSSGYGKEVSAVSSDPLEGHNTCGSFAYGTVLGLFPILLVLRCVVHCFRKRNEKKAQKWDGRWVQYGITLGLTIIIGIALIVAIVELRT